MLCGLYATAPALIVSFGITAGNFASVVKSWLKLQSGASSGSRPPPAMGLGPQ